MPLFFKKIAATENYQAHLVPADDECKEVVDKIENGNVVKCPSISSPRNYGHHRKFRALLSIVLINLPPDKYWESYNILFCTMNPDMAIRTLGELAGSVVFLMTTKDILDFIKFQLGYYERKYLGEGQVALELKSTSFSSMSQEVFNEFYDKSIDVILKYLLPPAMPGETAKMKHREELEAMVALEF